MRRNNIQVIDMDGARHVTQAAKMAALMAHYTRLLGETNDASWSFDIGQIYASRPAALGPPLIAPFTEEEAKTVVAAMNPNSAPGPDGLGPGFYKAAWLTVKSDIMRFLEAFHDGTTQLESINRAHIVLLPKKEGATAPGDFRPISLQNCPVKILTKILTTRLQHQIQALVDTDQTGFIRGRSISENFIYATELIQCCHRRRRPTIVLKLDFAKALDSVNWCNLMKIMQARGFPPLWLHWMLEILQTSH